MSALAATVAPSAKRRIRSSESRVTKLNFELGNLYSSIVLYIISPLCALICTPFLAVVSLDLEYVAWLSLEYVVSDVVVLVAM